MKQNLNKILLGLVTMSILSSNAFAVPVLATTKPVLTVTGTISAIATLALGTATATSGQTQTLTFPMVTGVIESKNMDGTQGGAASGLVVTDNDNNGFTIKVDSAFGGKMKGGATSILIPYSLTVDGTAVAAIPLTSAGSAATISLATGSAGLAPATGEVHILSASHAVLPSTQAADAYSDTVTFYLYSL